MVSKDTFIDLDKKARRKNETVFPLFNYQYVAHYSKDSDQVSILKVLKEEAREGAEWWS